MKRETLAHFVHMATGLGRFIGSQPFCGVLGFILDDMSDLVLTFARDFFEPNAPLSRADGDGLKWKLDRTPLYL
jgi:hypothetical protein